jgi:hypothetical protein
MPLLPSCPERGWHPCNVHDEGGSRTGDQLDIEVDAGIDMVFR